jgi:molybdate transport system regulatory protein
VLIFLLIRHTGAKLNEVLSLDPLRDIDHKGHCILFRSGDDGEDEQHGREVPLSPTLSSEISSMLADEPFRESIKGTLAVDPGFVRLKFYERARACGFPRRLGGPEMIRKSRAVELARNNMPLSAVQMLLGHSTPSLTSSYVSFSEAEIKQVTRHFIEKESSRQTSARNSFFGKVQSIQHADIQTVVVLSTVEGHQVTTVITNDSVERLGLRVGKLITAEVKAPWVILEKSDREPQCTAENRFEGVGEGINKGRVNTEYIVRISEGTRLCSIVTTESSRRLNLGMGDTVWALFNCFAVVLHVD